MRLNEVKLLLKYKILVTAFLWLKIKRRIIMQRASSA